MWVTPFFFGGVSVLGSDPKSVQMAYLVMNEDKEIKVILNGTVISLPREMGDQTPCTDHFKTSRDDGDERRRPQ